MIEVENLTKRFGFKTAVDDISLTVQKGEILGFLGPNGAGKSTAMRMITGFLVPSSGRVKVGGIDVTEDSLPARKKMGYLPENSPAYPDMTVKGFLDFCAGIRGFSGKEKSRRIEETIENCFLSDVRFQSINTLSKGYKQRVCFAQCILHDPEYLIMDEPTGGLDPNQKHDAREMIRRMGKDKYIILSTHNLEEVDAICTRVIIISQGKIVSDDTPMGLKTKSSYHGVVSFSLKPEQKAEFLQEIQGISGVRSVETLEQEDGAVMVRVYPADPMSPIANPILKITSQKGWTLNSLSVGQGRLEDVFRSITLPKN